jgi:hypothetical protein
MTDDTIEVVDGADLDAVLQIDPDARLSPADCTLIDDFVAP